MSCCDGSGVKLSQSSNLKQRKNSTTKATTSERNTSRNLLLATFQDRKTGAIERKGIVLLREKKIMFDFFLDQFAKGVILSPTALDGII